MPVRRLAAPEQPGVLHVPGGQVLKRTAAAILMLDTHGATGSRWLGWMRRRAWMDVFSSALMTPVGSQPLSLRWRR